MANTADLKVNVLSLGVDLRDLFAGMVMGTLVAKRNDMETDSDLARQAYRLADALLAAREGRG